MARSDSFFLRQTLNAENTGVYQQTPLDLGAYVDALGKSVLRIHNIAVSYTEADGTTVTLGANDGGAAQFQLLTQSQTGMVLPSNRAIVSTGTLIADNNAAAAGPPQYVSHDLDVAPQHWTQGYLVAVDSMFLGGRADTAFTTDVYISVTMECTVETMTQAAAMALSLSQQGA
jgi:hypothetical protein